MDRIQTPTTPAAPTVDVPRLLTTAADTLAGITTPALTELDILHAVLIAAPGLSAVQLRPVWEALPTGGSGTQPRAYAARLYAVANSDAEEALRRVQGRPAPTSTPRQAVAA